MDTVVDHLSRFYPCPNYTTMKNLHTVLPPFGFSHYYYKLKAVKTVNLLQNDKEISKLYLHAKNYTQNGLINKIIQHLVDLNYHQPKKKMANSRAIYEIGFRPIGQWPQNCNLCRHLGIDPHHSCIKINIENFSFIVSF